MWCVSTPAPANTWVAPATDPVTDWKPTASITTLQKRAELLKRIRSFFDARGVMEVDTPMLGIAGVTDLHIDNIEATVCGETRLLQSSPEYFMKRLLAAGSGPIYSLGKVFRDGEHGPRHNPEFTLLEWYRPGWDEYRLIDEIDTLVRELCPTLPAATVLEYGDLFESVTGRDPHDAPLAQLQAAAGQVCEGDWSGEPRTACLDALFSLEVEPRMPTGLVFVTHYPACQSALAQLATDQRGRTVARRFEVFLDRMELGNGYFELTDADEQQRRFRQDIALRQAAGKPDRAPDTKLLAALASGLPACAGVAIGFDRLVMKLCGASHIAGVLPFVE